MEQLRHTWVDTGNGINERCAHCAQYADQPSVMAGQPCPDRVRRVLVTLNDYTVPGRHPEIYEVMQDLKTQDLKKAWRRDE